MCAHSTLSSDPISLTAEQARHIAVRAQLLDGSATEILDTLTAEPLLENTTQGFAPRPSYRPLTKFEARGLALGHRVWDICFRRR